MNGGIIMKKTLLSMLAIIICLSLFSGCDNVLSENNGSPSTSNTSNANEDCKHSWELIPSSKNEYQCSICKTIHLCDNPNDWERIQNYNESTAVYKCKICGSEHFTTDPDSINPPSAETKYKIEFADHYEIANDLKEAYSAGEKVTIKLPTITEHYYVFYVNGVKQEPDESVSDDWTFTYYTFVMPGENVLVEIEDRWVEIPNNPHAKVNIIKES
jgi:hypothetical protein